jgi:hypothetical protein
MWDKVRGKESQSYAISINNLASTLKRLKKYEEAYELMK